MIDAVVAIENDLAGALAGYLSEGAFDRLPAHVVEAATELILDCVGVALAGSHEPPTLAVVDFVRDESAAPASSVIGHPLKTSPAGAMGAQG